PACRPHTYETSGLGAAIDAAVGMGIHTDFTTAVREMTRTSETFEPEPASHQRYEDLYQNVYLKMYRRLQSLYDSIQDYCEKAD
ncbi:MAG: carbohydrate kinase, partial [Anaerolineaceae bacterium]